MASLASMDTDVNGLTMDMKEAQAKFKVNKALTCVCLGWISANT